MVMVNGEGVRPKWRGGGGAVEEWRLHTTQHMNCLFGALVCVTDLKIS